MERINLNQINSLGKDTLLSNLGIEILDYSETTIDGKMPVDERTFQPMGLLHGGATAAFIETLGSFGSFLIIDNATQVAVCSNISVNHIRSAMDGDVLGKATLLHKGKSTHVWNIEVENEEGKTISTGRMTMMIISK